MKAKTRVKATGRPYRPYVVQLRKRGKWLTLGENSYFMDKESAKAVAPDLLRRYLERK